MKGVADEGLAHTIEGDRKEVAAFRTLNLLNAMGDRLGYGFSSSRFGNMSVKWEFEESKDGGLTRAEAERKVEWRRRHYAEVAGFDTGKMVVITPEAGNKVLVVSKEDCGKEMPPADALITTDKEVALILLPADCTPIIVTNKRGDFVAMVHAGRDGTNLRIIKSVVAKLREMGFADPSEFIVGMGPAVECYRGDFLTTNDPEMWLPHLYVKTDDSGLTETTFQVREELAGSKWKHRVVTEPTQEMFIDITECNVKQLVDLGVPRENIETAGICTVCNAKEGRTYSHGLSTLTKENRTTHPISRFLSYAMLK